MSIEPYILYVSHFHFYKNHVRLIEAFKICLENKTFSGKLVLVGSKPDSRYYKKVRNKIRKEGLDQKVVILPAANAKDLRLMYKKAAAFVFPSLIENCPNVLLEAFAANAVICASNYPPNPEFFGEAIQYFNPLNSNNIADCLGSVLAVSNQNNKKHSTKDLENLFSWEKFTIKILNLLAEPSN
jgi:glycosyltransferase involved in cell wall biosynthesis